MQIQNDSIIRNWSSEQMLASYEMMQTVPLTTLSDDEEPVKPPLNKGKVACEILAGFGVGGAGAFIMVSLFAASLRERRGGSTSYGDEAATQGLVVGFIAFCGAAVAYVYGSAAGVYWVGNTGDETGDWKTTLYGSMWGEVLLMSPVGAAIGFNMTRKYKTDEGKNGSMIDSKEKLSIELVRINF